MRVGSDAVGGAPFDAAAAKGAGDASGAGAGFFALLALLQGGVATGAVDAVSADELLDEATSGADGEGESDGGAAGDVIVSLSGAAVAGATADLAATAAGSGPQPGGASSPAVQIATVGTGVAEEGPGVALQLAEAAAGVASEGPGSAAEAPATAASGVDAPAAGAASDASKALPQGAPPATPTPSAARGSGAQSASETAVKGTTDAASVVTTAPAAEPTGGAAVDGRSAAAATTGNGAEHFSAAGDGEDPDGAEADERPYATFGEARRAQATSVEGEAPALGLEPASGTLQHDPTDGMRGNAGDRMPLARDGAGPVESASRATGSAQRAPLGDGTTLPSWIERIASPQRLAARRSTALRLDLEPAGLGRIEVRLSFGRDGVRAQVMTEHDHTRALLAQQQPQLASAFERNDLRLESFLVDVGVGGDASGEAHREVEDPAAWDAAFANGAAREGEHEVPSAIVVTGLLSVRA